MLVTWGLCTIQRTVTSSVVPISVHSGCVSPCLHISSQCAVSVCVPILSVHSLSICCIWEDAAIQGHWWCAAVTIEGCWPGTTAMQPLHLSPQGHVATWSCDLFLGPHQPCILAIKNMCWLLASYVILTIYYNSADNGTNGLPISMFVAYSVAWGHHSSLQLPLPTLWLHFLTDA